MRKLIRETRISRMPGAFRHMAPADKLMARLGFDSKISEEDQGIMKVSKAL